MAEEVVLSFGSIYGRGDFGEGIVGAAGGGAAEAGGAVD